jgi:tetratricopeptide (TPR) repeat protein
MMMKLLFLVLLASFASLPAEAVPRTKPDLRWNRLMVDGFNSKDVGNYLLAEQKFVAALGLVTRDDDPRKGVTLRMLGDCYSENKKIDAARYCYEQDAKLSKALGDDFSGRIYDLLPLSRCLLQQGQLKDAEKALLTIIQLAKQNDYLPELAESMELLGCVYLQENEPEKAQDIAQQLERLPYSIKTALPCMNLATCFSKRGDSETSIRLLNSAIAFRPKSLHGGSDGNTIGDAICTLGLRYMQRKDYALAERVLRRGLLLEDGPGFNNVAVLANINSWLAICLIDEQRNEEAIPYLERSLVLRPRIDSNFAASNPRYLARDRMLLDAIKNKKEIPPAALKIS